jgi:DNA-binding Xre family transcriptional regulator
MVARYVVPQLVVTADQAESVVKRLKSQLTANTARFAERLSNLMLERRPPLTQKALAERVGVTRAAVSRWLRQNRFPYPRNLNKICAVLGVHRQWLETGEGEKWLPGLHIH